MPFGCWLAPRQIATAALLVAMAIAPRVDAAGKHAAAHARSKPKSKPVAKECPAPKEETPIVVAGGKVAMFAFTGDDAEPIRRQMTHLLKSKGMKIMTSLRPVDSAEQYREMSVTLNLVAYIDGEVTIDGNDGSATIYVRNGATGKELWERLGPALSQACADAAKPRKGGREPMRINAGTPLTAADDN